MLLKKSDKNIIIKGLDLVLQDLFAIRKAAIKRSAKASIINFINNEIIQISKFKDYPIEKAAGVILAKKEPDHLMPRKHVFRKNYDYGEGWPKIMDDFRSGKIKNIRDFIEKKRKDPSPIKDIYEK